MKKYIVSSDNIPKASELLQLFEQTTWAKNRTLKGVGFLLSNCEHYVVIRDADHKLIGFGRAISDGVYRAMLDDIVVDQEYRKQGIGKIIVEELLVQLVEVEQVFLNTKPELQEFYTLFGFEKCKAFTMSL